MERIEIVTQLVAAAIIRSNYVINYVQENEVEQAGRIADLILAYDDVYQSVDNE